MSSLLHSFCIHAACLNFSPQRKPWVPNPSIHLRSCLPVLDGNLPVLVFENSHFVFPHLQAFWNLVTEENNAPLSVSTQTLPLQGVICSWRPHHHFKDSWLASWPMSFHLEVAYLNLLDQLWGWGSWGSNSTSQGVFAIDQPPDLILSCSDDVGHQISVLGLSWPRVTQHAVLPIILGCTEITGDASSYLLLLEAPM